MNKFLHYNKLLLCIFWCLVANKAKSENSKEYDALIRSYQLAYNNSDFSLLNSYVFTQQQFVSLVNEIKLIKPQCITDLENSFDVKTFEDKFEKSHLYKLKSDSIILNEILELKNCAGLDIKRLNCFIYFKNQNKSIPVSIIVLDLGANQKRIIEDIINENHFSNEKF